MQDVKCNVYSSLSLSLDQEKLSEKLHLFFFRRRRRRRNGSGLVRSNEKLARVDLFISGTYLPT